MFVVVVVPDREVEPDRNSPPVITLYLIYFTKWGTIQSVFVGISLLLHSTHPVVANIHTYIQPHAQHAP